MIGVLLLTLVLSLTLFVQANVEKTIFVAPESLTLPQDASIDNLLLTPLTPDNLIHRTHFNASFPTDEKPRGEDTWVLLEGLTPGQRYELRVCWLATQPTSFWINTHSLTSAFEDPALITSLSIYSHARHAQLDQTAIENLHQRRYNHQQNKETSLLLLQIQAAADYFSLNKTLMEHVPPVHVDLILDPYLLNVFPQSLGPTAIYVGIVAVLAWLLSGWAYRRIIAYAASQHHSRLGHEKKMK